MTVQEVLVELKSLSIQDHFNKLAHFGINSEKALGVKVPLIRHLAKRIGKNHDLTAELWNTGVHEACLLASMIEIPSAISELQFDSWVNDFDSWDICDQ